ncbi:MAG: hypothetical protein H6658_05850 [Ardenticatenaceae bacterium]|nr:hypothetical protein [Ardenticatenaceae bacterium]
MNEIAEDVMISYAQFNDHLSELRAICSVVVTDAELIEAAKNGSLVARQQLKLEDGTVFNIGDSVPIPAEHTFCNPEMITTKQHLVYVAKFEAAKNHLPIVNRLAGDVQQARRAVGDTESLIRLLPRRIKSVETTLNRLRERQETAESELFTALTQFYQS